MAKRRSNKIEPNYSEEVVGFALESYLSVFSFPFNRFILEPFTRSEENWLGADAKLKSQVKGFKPLYMQFKRPFAYPDFSQSKIITDRKKNTPKELETSPHILFFKLQNKNKGQREYQHNVFYRWRNRLIKYGNIDAVYVCPLFLNSSNYRAQFHLTALRNWLRIWRSTPFSLRRASIFQSNNRFDFNSLPLISEHITIPPHKLVSDANHYYSFTEKGNEIFFHSPSLLENESHNLAEWLNNQYVGVYNGENLIQTENSQNVLRELLDTGSNLIILIQ